MHSVKIKLLSFICTEQKRTWKRIFFLQSLSLLNVSIKLDSLLTHLEAMSLLFWLIVNEPLPWARSPPSRTSLTVSPSSHSARRVSQQSWRRFLSPCTDLEYHHISVNLISHSTVTSSVLHHVTITHDALDLIGTNPPDSDIWRPSLETQVPTHPPLEVYGFQALDSLGLYASYWNALSFQASVLHRQGGNLLFWTD